MVLLIVITSLIFKKRFCLKVEVNSYEKKVQMKKICSIPFSFRALQTEVLFKITLYLYTHVLCNMGGGAVFLRISKHKEGKTDSRTCISKRYVGLNLDYLFGVKSIFTFHNLPSLSFFVQFPGMRLVISSAMC